MKIFRSTKLKTLTQTIGESLVLGIGLGMSTLDVQPNPPKADLPTILTAKPPQDHAPLIAKQAVAHFGPVTPMVAPKPISNALPLPLSHPLPTTQSPTTYLSLRSSFGQRTYDFLKRHRFKIALLCATVIGCLCDIVIFQKYLIFLPTKADQKHTFQTWNENSWLANTYNSSSYVKWTKEEEKLTLTGIYHHQYLTTSAYQKPEKILLVFHGNAGNIDSRVDILDTLHNAMHGQSSIFLIDYRGYGASTGTIEKESDLYEDAKAAYDYVINTLKYTPENISVMGISLGGAPATHIASKYTIDKLILKSTFTSIPDVAASFINCPWLSPLIRPFCYYPFDNLDRMSKITCPTLIIHGEKDNLIPHAQGQKLFNDKQLCNYQGDHNDDLDRNNVKKAIGNFFKR